MIVVTGGSGKAGRACLDELVGHGYDLCNVDLVSGSDPRIPFSQVDLTDFGQTMAALSAIDERVHKVTGIVHLAAIPAPGRAPNHVTFETNTISTYNNNSPQRHREHREEDPQITQISFRSDTSPREETGHRLRRSPLTGWRTSSEDQNLCNLRIFLCGLCVSVVKFDPLSNARV